MSGIQIEGQVIGPQTRGLCPHSMQSHVYDMKQEQAILGAPPKITLLTKPTVMSCAGEACAVWSKAADRCGHIAATADEIAEAVSRKLKEGA